MTAINDPRQEPRPRDFTARISRSRPRSLATSRRNTGKGRFALALAGAVALPAFASPGQWDRFQIGDAGEEQVVLEPMPFEKAGSSFPGSAFYYLDPDEPDPALDGGVHSDADIDRPRDRLDPGPAARALRIDNSGVDRTRALDCLTAAVYYEAASEPDSGQRAVAQVVLNRVAHTAYPDTICGVVYQGSQRSSGCQFTFTCDGSLARRPNRMFWLRAENVARAALAGYVHAPVGLATHYHTVQVSPYWSRSLRYVGTIGAHRFYRFEGTAGSPAAFRFAYHGGEPAASSLKASAIAAENGATLDPVALQRSYDTGLQQAQAIAGKAAPATPAPSYTQELRDRGGDALYRGENLPEATGVKPEYRDSGRWIARPGA